MLPGEQVSTNFGKNPNTDNFAATQDSAYEVDEYIPQSRPSRQRKFPKKYDDFVVKKVSYNQFGTKTETPRNQ